MSDSNITYGKSSHTRSSRVRTFVGNEYTRRLDIKELQSESVF